MQESEFWDRLEYRVCAELSGMPERWQRRYWCDGFLPEEYEIDREEPQISGYVWLGEGDRRQSRWTFRLLIPKSFRSRDEIDWASLLPADDVTRWLKLDLRQQQIEIEPAAAVPDLPKLD